MVATSATNQAVAGLTILDGSNRHAVVAFSDDPELALVHGRLSAYSGPVPDGQKTAPHQALFDFDREDPPVRSAGPDQRRMLRLRRAPHGL